MAKGYGKQFEKDFLKSVACNIWVNRFKDGGGWSNGTNTRFTPKNICDFEVYNPYTKQLYYLELKHTNSKSLPFGNIKESQIKGLTKSNEFGIVSGFLINVIDKCFFLEIDKFNKFVHETERKSIPLSYLKENALPIPSYKLQKYYRYDLTGLMEVVR